MASKNYYFGHDGRIGMGYEWMSSGQAGTSYATAATADQEISWPRGTTVSVNENVTRERSIGTTHGRDPDDSIKGIHETTGTISWLLPDEITVASNGIANDICMMKLGFDSLNSWNSTSANWAIPSAAHGSNQLPSFTLEAGHSRSGTSNPRYLKISGCTASSFNLKAASGEYIECSIDWQGKGVQWLSGAMAGTTRSIKMPLDFGNCTVKLDGTAVTETTGFEFTIDNNLMPNYGLNAQGSRVLTDIIAGNRDITGTLTVNMASGNVTNDLFKFVLSGTTPTVDTHVQTLSLTVAGVSGSFATGFTNVVFGDLSMDIDPSKVQEIAIPWGAEQADLTIWGKESLTVPTNWVQDGLAT